MPDHPARYDWTTITPERAWHLKELVGQQTRLQMFAWTKRPSDLDCARWTKLWMENEHAIDELRFEIAAAAYIVPWTAHIAGAPGHDVQFVCDNEECENEWCGIVQKCSRCQDALCLGFTGMAFYTESATQALYGRTLQDHLHERYGDNPVDEDGPAWLPIGTCVVKRADPRIGEEVVIVDPVVEKLDVEVRDCTDLRGAFAKAMLEPTPA